ncbi:hypothetical protein CEQ28_015300 [Hafnia alvei]|nr:hypothetical protein CEQ28_015300 [Hafnia alvei]
MDDIPVVLQDAGVLAAFAYPSHIVIYAPRASQTCRLPASRSNLGIDNIHCCMNTFYLLTL